LPIPWILHCLHLDLASRTAMPCCLSNHDQLKGLTGYALIVQAKHKKQMFPRLRTRIKRPHFSLLHKYGNVDFCKTRKRQNIGNCSRKSESWIQNSWILLNSETESSLLNSQILTDVKSRNWILGVGFPLFKKDKSIKNYQTMIKIQLDLYFLVKYLHMQFKP
jgi:hypothetical protein